MSEGSRLGLVWVVPFAGLLLSIAVLPLLSPPLWRRHFGTVSALWALAFALPFALGYGIEPALGALWQALVVDFLPFAILLTTLFTVAGGIRLTGTIRGTPGVNTLMLLIGTAAASVMGTTGAAMLVLRPLIRANRRRRRNTHVFVFFIFLVANIGGALTPLGDPPLLIGFLQGVPFFWPAVHLALPTIATVVVLLVLFYALDRHFHDRFTLPEPSPVGEIERLGLEGKVNLVLLALVPVAVFVSGAIGTGTAALLGNAALVVITLASLLLTSPRIRAAEDFSWAPMIEVGLVFAGIFITVMPVLAMLRAGPQGALAPLVALVAPHGRPDEAMYFWLSGGLSSLLDSAPTYLVFFNLAGGDPAALTGPLVGTLTAISAGAVLMGANTYIGNAPNFMVKAICEERGIAMPSFFGFIVWSSVILLPIYAMLTVVLFS